jgi:hypothetical protein
VVFEASERPLASAVSAAPREARRVLTWRRVVGATIPLGRDDVSVECKAIRRPDDPSAASNRVPSGPSPN